nr:hypothetical protein [Tanacetum cinerariifolium]
SASSTTPPTPTPITTVVSAPRLSATAKGTDEGTGSRQGVPDVPSDDSEEELSWNSSDDEEGTDEGTGSKPGVPDVPSDDSEEELSWKSSDDEDDLRLSEEARIQEEEDADKLYRDVNINQGMGLQVTQNVEDTHVNLTPVNPDGPQESSSMSSFVSSMLNPINDVGVESIFMTTSSPIVSLQSQTPIMTPSTIVTITTSENNQGASQESGQGTSITYPTSN